MVGRACERKGIGDVGDRHVWYIRQKRAGTTCFKHTTYKHNNRERLENLVVCIVLHCVIRGQYSNEKQSHKCSFFKHKAPLPPPEGTQCKPELRKKSGKKYDWRAPARGETSQLDFMANLTVLLRKNNAKIFSHLAYLRS